MAITPIRTGQITTWLPSDGRYSKAEAYNVRESGYSGLNMPGRGEATLNYGYGPNEQAVVRSVSRGTPGSPTITLDSFLAATRDRAMEMHLTDEISWIQERVKGCGTQPDNPRSNDVIFHIEFPRSGDASIGDKSADFASEDVPLSIPYTGESYAVLFTSASLSALTTTETADANAAVLIDWGKSGCGSAYSGPNKTFFIACDAAAAATANILYSNDKGATIAATSADPFAADEHASYPLVAQRSDTQFRLFVSRITTDGSNPAEIAYADVTYGDEGTTTWTTVNVGSNNGDVVTSAFTPSGQIILVAVDDNKIFRSSDQGETFSQVWSGSAQINAFAKDDTSGYLYAAGASNTLLRSTDDGASWSAITGPTGSNASTSIAVANDAIWLGNGTSIFYTQAKKPSSANQWESQKDFGTNHQVKTIHCAGRSTNITAGSGILPRVVVTDTSGNEGDLWYSLDGGETWEEETNVTNSGYGFAAFSRTDDSFSIIPGEDNGSTAVIHKYSV